MKKPIELILEKEGGEEGCTCSPVGGGAAVVVIVVLATVVGGGASPVAMVVLW
jgi:hypothetical protein